MYLSTKETKVSPDMNNSISSSLVVPALLFHYNIFTQDLFDYKEERISVIKVGSSFYCRRVPLTSIPLDEGASE